MIWVCVSEIVFKKVFLLRKISDVIQVSSNFGGTSKSSDIPLKDLKKNHTLPETNSSPLKMIVSNRNILFQWSIFRGELLVSGRVSCTWNQLPQSSWGTTPPRDVRELATWRGMCTYSVKYTICKWSNVYVRILSHNKLYQYDIDIVDYCC